jgi:hypothetical protein
MADAYKIFGGLDGANTADVIRWEESWEGFGECCF